MQKLLILFAFLFTMLLTYNVFAQNWQMQNSNFPTNITVTNFSPVNDLVCWAGGLTIGSQIQYPGYIRTSNGGNSWTCDSIPSIPNGLISQVFAIDADTAYMAVYVMTSSNSKGVYKTTDGGTTWNRQSAYNSAFYGPGYLYFFDASNGVVIGDPNLETYTTTNGGQTWNQITMPAAPDEYTWVGGTAIAGYGNSVWFCSTKRFFHSTDRGNTWAVSTSLPTFNMLVPCLAFQDENTGIFSLEDYNAQTYIYRKTTDGGITWTILSNTILDNLNPTCIIHIPGTTATYLVSGGREYGKRGFAATFNAGENWILWDTVGCLSIGFSSFQSGWGNPYPTYQVHKYVGAPLPVELASFTTEVLDQKVILRWTTSTELNNNGFEIQRRVVESEFATIGFVRGEGTTTNQTEYAYIDKDLTDGKYYYRLKQFDFKGSYEYSSVVEVEVRSLDNYTLEQNYPNPFNPTTTIGYVLKEKSNTKLILLNSIGEEVAVLVNEEQDKGFHKVDFSASTLSSGVYFYRLEAGSFVQTRKMILLK
jgi:photosystem II stability/assembly factor-like uncharacterized protein